MARKKPTLGHKLVRVQCYFEAKCECGWRSGMHGSTGARGSALEEWRAHINSCAPSPTARSEGQP